MHEYPHEIAERLRELLTRSRKIEFDAYEGPQQDLDALKKSVMEVAPIPSTESLRELLDAAFFASLSQEEGQPATFTLIYSNPEIAASSAWTCVRLKDPLPLSTEHIRKLSPAAPPSTVDIAVFEHDGRLKIWGLLYTRYSTPTSRSFSSGLTVTAVQTGVLTVKFTDREILSYSRGDSVFFEVDQSLDAVRLQQLLARVFDDDRPFSEKFRMAAVLLRMASVPLNEGAGATLLVIPENHSLKALDTPRYEADTASRKILLEALSTPERAHVIAASARLLCIDGAVLFQEGVGLIGAGAMIRTQEVEDFPIRILAPHNYQQSQLDITLSKFNGGARHRSALIFCYMNPGALAIVVSQDGVMSLLVRPLMEKRVVAIRPIRRGVQLP